MNITTEWQPTLDKPQKWDHLVQFYREENFLYSGVGHYLNQALSEGCSVVVIATEAHRRAFE